MRYIFSLIIIILIILLFIYQYPYISYSEHFDNDPTGNRPIGNCVIGHYDNKSLFTPIRMVKKTINRFKLDKGIDYIDNNLVFNDQDFQTIIDEFPDIHAPINKYKELSKFKYDYFSKPKYEEISKNKIDTMIQTLFDKCKEHLEESAYKIITICNITNKCNLSLKKYTILKVGRSDTNNIIIEGQLLLTFEYKRIDYLLDFVISDENTFTIHSIKLTGFDFNSNINMDSQPIYRPEQHLNIYSNPIFNKYKADNGYYVSDNNRPILKSRDYQMTLLKDKYNKSNENYVGDYKCFGKFALNKSECEAINDKEGYVQKTTGVWDKKCVKDDECPFFKSNKNYPNTSGSCKNGFCEMPTGVLRISPHKYINKENALCYNCKKGFKCCEEQYDTSLYPELSSPDYKFNDDMELRTRHTQILKNKGLQTL